jgi:hypothetical protein
MVGACATCPTPPAAPPTPAPPAAPAVPAQASLLEYVPQDAVAALVVRSHAFSYTRAYFAERPGLQQELSGLLLQRLGIDLTRVDGLVAYVVDIKRGVAALFLRLPPRGDLARPQAPSGTYRGVPLYHVDSQVFMAALPDGMVVGSEEGVKVAIAHEKAKPAVAPDSLAAILEAEAKDTDAALAVKAVPFGSREVDRFVADYGVRHGSLSITREQLLTLRLRGDGRRLGGLIDLIKGAEALALSHLEQEKNKAMAKPGLFEALGSTVGVFETQRLFQETEPKLVGDTLTSRYQASVSMGGTAMVGVLAALAIPAYQKYVARARAAEAERAARLEPSPVEETRALKAPKQPPRHGHGRSKGRRK